MNWITVEIEHLEDAKVAALVDALRTAALQTGQTDPAPRIIQTVVTEIRRKVASCSRNQVDADPAKIPASLLTLASDRILAQLKGRLEIPLTTFEEQQLSRHDETLNRIASCTDVVEQPDDSAAPEVQATAGTPSMSCHRRETRNARRSGL